MATLWIIKKRIKVVKVFVQQGSYNKFIGKLFYGACENANAFVIESKIWNQIAGAVY